jgi:hypothetical protein
MTATKWRFILFEDSKTKAHIVPAILEKPLLRDLEARGHNIKANVKPILVTGLDEAGMCHQDRPWEELVLSGLKINFPSEAVVSFWDRFRRSPLRCFAGAVARDYYKIHDPLRCLVMTPAQKGRLEVQLAQRTAAAEQRAHEFYADKRPIRDILREVNARVSNVPIEQMPDYTGPADRLSDRFIPRERGKA